MNDKYTKFKNSQDLHKEDQEGILFLLKILITFSLHILLTFLISLLYIFVFVGVSYYVVERDRRGPVLSFLPIMRYSIACLKKYEHVPHGTSAQYVESLDCGVSQSVIFWDFVSRLLFEPCTENQRKTLFIYSFLFFTYFDIFYIF